MILQTNTATDEIRAAIRREREQDRASRPVRVLPRRAEEPAAPRPEPGLPSLAAGIGKSFMGSAGPKVVSRPGFATAEVAAALDTALDYNPDASFAAWVFKLLGLRDWELIALGDDGEPDAILQADVEAFAGRVCLSYGGGVDAMLLVGMDSILRRGAVAVELDIADSRADVVDVDFVDPLHVDFEPVTDGVHKSIRPVYVPQVGEPVAFNPATFRYLGLTPRAGQPHGTPPLLPLVDTAYPAAAFRDSLSRVAKNQGWSRMAFLYDFDRVVRSAPPDVVKIVEGGGVEILDWDRLTTHVEAFRADLLEDVEDMIEDDTWVLPDIVKPSSVGANHTTESFDFSKLAQQFDTDVIASAKSQPAIHGRQWGSDLSSTGSIQWIVQALGIEAMRDCPRRAVEFVLNQWLRITGRRGSVELALGEIRKDDRTAEVAAKKTEAETAIMLRDAGWIDDDEAATMTVGHDATGSATGAEPTPGVFSTAPRAAVGTGELPAPAETLSWDAHERGCDCDDCDAQGYDRLDAFTPTTADAANEIELDNDADPDADDADRIARAFDRWARDNAPTFRGMLDAVIVDSAPLPDETGRMDGHRADPIPSARWQWDKNVSRWRYPSASPNRLGRLLPPDRADVVFERRMGVYRDQGKAATERLLTGDLTVRQWQDEMKRIQRDLQLEARMIAVGGKNAMTPTDYGAAGGRIGHENRALGRLGKRIEAGELSPGQIRNAVRGRFEAGPRETYRRGREASHRKAGYQEERSILGASEEHCNAARGRPGCVEEAGRAWVPIGESTPIGNRACSSGCHCHIEYRYDPEHALPPHRGGG